MVVACYIMLFKILVAWFISVRQKDLVKEVMVCGDVSMSTYKIWHPDDTDDPQDVGLSSDDEATGMREEIGIARRIARLSGLYRLLIRRAELCLHQLKIGLPHPAHRVPQVSLRLVS